MMSRSTCIAIAFAFISIGASAQSGEDRFAAVEMKATHVSGSVHMLTGLGGNIGVSIGTDGTLIIDDQFAPLADKILTALGDLGGDRPKLVLNTHYHGDHTGANAAMAKSGTIISHQNVRVRLLNTEAFPAAGLPVVTYDDTLSVHFNDDHLRIIHLPKGHTDGDSAIWFTEAGVAHLGDHLFTGGYPFVDIAGGGSIDGFVDNLRRMLDLLPAETKVIPGHGPLGTTQDINDAIVLVSSAADLAREALANGTEPEALVTLLDDAFPGAGDGIISTPRWIEIVQADAAN